MMQQWKAREAAVVAVYEVISHGKKLRDVLEEWRRKSHPSSKDASLAQEISYGTVRRFLTLDYIIQKASISGKMPSKPKEKALLRTACYQLLFMDRLPVYAVVNEMVALAKKYSSRAFANFVNALLRKLSEHVPMLPSGDEVTAWSVRYSFPLPFVEKLLVQRGKETALSILKAENLPGTVMVRCVGTPSNAEGLREVHRGRFHVFAVDEGSRVSSLAQQPMFYIQNVTPVCLLEGLWKCLEDEPHSVLDLCAAPGGKLLLLSELFPKARLYANESHSLRLKALEQNLDKYGVSANLSCCRGEELVLMENVDLIVVDAPCTNSGVFHKRPEARWRFNEAYLRETMQLQMALLGNSVKLLREGGTLWYLTCSLLKEENEELVAEACHRHGLVVASPFFSYLPNESGWDGGFACSLRKSRRKYK